MRTGTSLVDGVGPKLSVMMTCYRSEAFIGEMLAALEAALVEIGCTYEIILVDDASPDGTFGCLTELFDRYPGITHAIRLMRNVGQLTAITPAIAVASGRYIAYLDSDLQYDPRDLGALVREMERGFHMVSGVRVCRRDPLHRRVASKVTSSVIRFMTGLDLPDYGCAIKIFDARVLKAFDFSPTQPFHPLAAMVAAGKVGNVPVNHRSRKHGVSGWTVLHLYYYLTDILVGLFQRPAHLAGVGFAGVAALAGGAAGLAYLVGGAGVVLPSLPVFLVLLSVLCLGLAFSLFTFSLVLRTYLRGMRHPAYIVDLHLSRPFVAQRLNGEGAGPC